MKKFLSLVVILSILFFSACAEEPLPQLQPVTLSQGASQPQNIKDNFVPKPENYSELSYHDDTIDVKVYHIRRHDTPIVVAFVQIASPDQLRTELARPYPSQATNRIYEMAKRVNSVLAVNGDWFTYHNRGIAYRNGEKLRSRSDDEYDGLVIDTNGDFHIMRPMSEENYASLDTPIMHSFIFGPALVIDGEVQEIVNRKVTYKQRMAIGQISHLSYVLVATDGPDQNDSVGLNVPQLAQLMKGLGATQAYNLDGGQSTSIMLGDTKLNGQNPKRMRAVGDIIYFATGIK